MSTSIHNLKQNPSMYFFLIPYEKTKDLSHTNAGNDKGFPVFACSSFHQGEELLKPALLAA